jgi:hypothetical protein
MAVTPAKQMKMVMAQLVLDNLLDFFSPVGFVLQGADLNIVRDGKISSARRPQPAIEGGPVKERPSKIAQRDVLDPLLQFLIRHLLIPRPARRAFISTDFIYSLS